MIVMGNIVEKRKEILKLFPNISVKYPVREGPIIQPRSPPSAKRANICILTMDPNPGSTSTKKGSSNPNILFNRIRRTTARIHTKLMIRFRLPLGLFSAREKGDT